MLEVNIQLLYSTVVHTSGVSRLDRALGQGMPWGRCCVLGVVESHVWHLDVESNCDIGTGIRR